MLPVWLSRLGQIIANIEPFRCIKMCYTTTSAVRPPMLRMAGRRATPGGLCRLRAAPAHSQPLRREGGPADRPRRRQALRRGQMRSVGEMCMEGAGHEASLDGLPAPASDARGHRLALLPRHHTVGEAVPRVARSRFWLV